MELVLKAAIGMHDYNIAHKVITFAQEHNYLLQIDEQSAWLLTLQSQPNQSTFDNYHMIRLFLTNEISLRLPVTEKNKE